MKKLQRPGDLPRPVSVHLRASTTDVESSRQDMPGEYIIDEAGRSNTRGQTIERQMQEGIYEYGIFCDEDIDRNSVIWYCQTCWTVFHKNCIAKVVVQSAPQTGVYHMPDVEWKCPNCRARYAGSPWEMCCESCMLKLKAETCLIDDRV